MTTREQSAYIALRDKAFTRLDRVDRIENRVGAGYPDVTYTVAGHDGWIELKAPLAPRNKALPLLTSNHNHPMLPEQVVWFKRHIAAGGRAFVYVETEEHRILLPGALAQHVNDMTLEGMRACAEWRAERKKMSAKQWAMLRATLKGG